jgi:hypothetical protein
MMRDSRPRGVAAHGSEGLFSAGGIDDGDGLPFVGDITGIEPE